jgi:hypothetical protein
MPSPVRGNGNTAISVAYGSTILAIPPTALGFSFVIVLLLVPFECLRALSFSKRLVIDPLAKKRL